MERSPDLQNRLDQLGRRVGEDIQRVNARQSWVDGLSKGLFWFTLVPAAVLVVQLVRYWTGSEAAFVPTPLVIVAAVLLPIMAAAWFSRRARAQTVAAQAGLQAVDRQLGLEDRLTSAQDLLQRKVPGGFAEAAIEDGQAKLAQAESAQLQWQPVTLAGGVKATGWLIAGATLLLLVTQVALWQHTRGAGDGARGLARRGGGCARSGGLGDERIARAGSGSRERSARTQAPKPHGHRRGR